MKTVKKAAVLLMTMLLVSALTASAYAHANIVYNGKTVTLDVTADGSEAELMDLFEDLFTGMMPGDTRTQTITLKNGAENKYLTRNYLKIEAPGTTYDKLLKDIEMTVGGSGGTIFVSKAGEAFITSQWIELGTLAPGAEFAINVTVKAPVTMGNDVQFAEAPVIWRFKVEEGSVATNNTTTTSTSTTSTGGSTASSGSRSPVDGKGDVKTGDTDTLPAFTAYAVIAAAALFAVSAAETSKKRRQNSNE